MRAYSVDLRKAALKLRKQGKSYKEVTELLGVSRSTVYLWSKRDFLAPYSPDLNPIERIWGNIKTKLRNSLRSFPEDLLSALWQSIESFYSPKIV